MPTIPDYERPIAAAIDYLATRPDVDIDRIGLLGVSMAGYYAMRAAAFVNLEGILPRVQCPVLITHGVNDEMVPVASAHRTHDEIGSADKTLRIYTPEEGGDTHINIDNWSQVVPVMADWLVERLSPSNSF